MESSHEAEAPMQTPDQKTNGRATYRIYLAGAWLNIEGQAHWKNLPHQELIRKIEEEYDTPK